MYSEAQISLRGCVNPAISRSEIFPFRWKPDGHGPAGDLSVHAAGPGVHARLHRGQLGLPPPKVHRNNTGSAIWRLFFGLSFVSIHPSYGVIRNGNPQYERCEG